MNKYFILAFISVGLSSGYAQQYHIKQYRVDKGLPSDIIKGVAQDSLGYFWIASDEGIIKYDGIKFTSYREAMHSNYAKGLFTTKKGKLLAYGDLDLIEIKNLGDTVIFNSLCPVTRIATDSTLSYPKLIFEDSEENIWVSESQSVVRLSKNGSFRRYDFDISNRSPQFLRAFAFFEDLEQNLFTSSVQGNVFKYNKNTDGFEQVPDKFPSGVEFIATIDNKIVIGAENGVSEAIIIRNGFKNPELKMKIPFVSFVAVIDKSKYFISTRGNQHYIADPETYTAVPIGKPVNNINNVYVSRDHDIWMSSNEGLILMRKNLFQSVNEKSEDFIESITENPETGIIYYATSNAMYEFDRNTNTNRELLTIPGGYFQSLYFTKDGIWVTNGFRVFLLSEGKITRQYDFSDQRKFITEITRGPLGNIWLTIPGSKDILMINTTTYKVHHLPLALEKDGVVNVVRESPDGMYAAATGKTSYLHFKPKHDTVFKNISVPLPFELHGDFNITDLTSSNNMIWLATSEGLLKYDQTRISKVDLGERFNGLPVKSIKPHPGNKILVSTAYGMILYDIETGMHDLFNESSGLLSNTITNHGLFISKNSDVWVGTAKGLCFSTQPLTELSITPAPRFTDVSANGKQLRTNERENIPYGSFLTVTLSSITFPENELLIQYRFSQDEQWKNAAGYELRFSDLPYGDHTLEVRTKKNGPYAWSESSFLNFSIQKPVWQRLWFSLFVVALMALLIGGTSILINARNEKRNKRLQFLIDERTNELKLRNEELVNLNQEKNNLIGIVAHDLKSPLKQIMGLLSLIKITGKIDDESATFVNMAESSATRLDNMIKKILDVEAVESRKLNLHMESIQLCDLVNAVVDRYDLEASRKDITIIRHINSPVLISADKNYLEQVLENLLSNAVKFSPKGLKIHTSVKIADNEVICEVRDEGPGISEEDKKRLFGKYQKLSARPTGDESSTGLGLSIVKKFVDAMGGRIWCESELNKGAAFLVGFRMIKPQRDA